MTSDEHKGGFSLGGIGFGVGAPRASAEVATGERAARPGAAVDGLVEVEGMVLPMRVLVVGDFTPVAENNAGILPPTHAVRLAAGELDALFSALKPRLSLEVESVLHEGAKIRVDVPLGSLLAFRPDALCRDVAPLRALLDGKEILERLRSQTIGFEAASAELARRWEGAPLLARVLGGVTAPALRVERSLTPAAPPAEDAADRILGMLDLDAAPPSSKGADEFADDAPPPPRTANAPGRFDAFLAAVAHSGKGATGAPRPDEAIRIVERALGAQLGAILQHPEFRRLEEAYRGLALLVARTPKTGVLLDVVSCRADESSAALARIAGESDGTDVAPVTLAVVDHEVTRAAASLAWFRELAETAETHRVVVVTNAAPSLLGTALSEVERLDYPGALFEAPASAPWRAEVHRASALWTCLAMNRFYARGAYDARASRVREATVVEAASGAEGEVWIRAAYAIAVLAVKSHARYEWPCGVTGARDGGLVDNLSVREISVASSERIAIPTEAFLSTETQRALSRLGITAFASQPNSDAAYLMTATTAYVPPPKRTYDGASSDPEVRFPATTLTDQLFVARLAQALDALGQRIARAGHSADARAYLQAGLGELFRNAPPSGPELELAIEEGAAALTVRPRRFLGVGLEELTLRIPLR